MNHLQHNDTWKATRLLHVDLASGLFTVLSVQTLSTFRHRVDPELFYGCPVMPPSLGH